MFDFFYTSLGELDTDKLLSKNELRGVDNPFVHLIFFLYSMEPPLYSDLNKAYRTSDNSKLKTLGPFAAVINKILYNGSFCDI